ncbi:MAG: sulfatase/phosphatase domain-containing protein, partial [Bacteroidota bacterium]
DYLPSILEILNLEYPDNRPLDGESILPLLSEKNTKTRKPLVFAFGKQAAVIDGNYKIYRKNEETSFQLFDLQKDPAEQHDLSKEQPEKYQVMMQYWSDWRLSQEKSLAGEDY